MTGCRPAFCGKPQTLKEYLMPTASFCCTKPYSFPPRQSGIKIHCMRGGGGSHPCHPRHKKRPPQGRSFFVVEMTGRRDAPIRSQSASTLLEETPWRLNTATCRARRRSSHLNLPCGQTGSFCITTKQEGHPVGCPSCLVEMTGFEPATSTFRRVAHLIFK